MPPLLPLSISHGPKHQGRNFPPRLPGLSQTKEDIINRKIALTFGCKAKIGKKLLGSYPEAIIPKGKSTVLSKNNKELEAVHIDEA